MVSASLTSSPQHQLVSFRSSVHTSDDERRVMFIAFAERFQMRHSLDKKRFVAAIAARLGRTPGMVYHWLSKAQRNRAIPWAMLDVIHYEEVMMNREIQFGYDMLSMYRPHVRMIPLEGSTIHTSDEERRFIFTQFLERFEQRHDLLRKQSVTAISIRVCRTPPMVYHWMSETARTRAVPWPMMDVLLYEEKLLDNGINLGLNILSLYENTGRLANSYSVTPA